MMIRIGRNQPFSGGSEPIADHLVDADQNHDEFLE
jgi:hypothetical protein